jgi:hypothetical protein
MASKFIFPTAGPLLRRLAYMLHSVHCGPVITIHVPGAKNLMADIASRPSKALARFAPSQSHLYDVAFASSFDSAFPLTHGQVWDLATVPEWLKSNVFTTLRGQQLALQKWAPPNEHDTGNYGNVIVNSTKQTATASPLPTPKVCSSLLLSPCRKVSLASEIKSRFNQCPRLSVPLAKSRFWTDITTPDKPPQPSNHLTSQ